MKPLGALISRGEGRNKGAKRRERGDGSLYRRPGTRYWWIAYSVAGKRVPESTGTTNRREAADVLRDRLSKVAAGQVTVQRPSRLTFEDLRAGLVEDYKQRGRRSLDRAERALAHLAEFFAGYRALAITPASVAAYTGERLSAGAARASVHYEVAILKRAVAIAGRQRILPARLDCENVTVENARRGFFEREEFETLRAKLPPELRRVVTFAYVTGWRVQSEVLPLGWSQVDLTAGVVRLEPGTTKSGAGREFPFAAHPELAAVLKAQRASADEIERTTGRPVHFVFHRADGRQIRSFRWAWRSACKAAKLVGRIPHDFRRTAVRNLARAGVPRSVAMELVGHRTEAIYRRYAIVATSDLSDGVARLAGLAEEPRVLPFQRRAQGAGR